MRNFFTQFAMKRVVQDLNKNSLDHSHERRRLIFEAISVFVFMSWGNSNCCNLNTNYLNNRSGRYDDIKHLFAPNFEPHGDAHYFHPYPILVWVNKTMIRVCDKKFLSTRDRQKKSLANNLNLNVVYLQLQNRPINHKWENH